MSEHHRTWRRTAGHDDGSIPPVPSYGKPTLPRREYATRRVPFKAGDLVKIAPGGLTMTVISVGNDTALLEWTSRNAVVRGTFEVSRLMPA